MKIYWSDKMKKYAVVLTALIAIAGFSLLVGRISLSELLYSSQNEFFDMILFEIRLPRLIAAFFIGASLSVAGAAFQAIFQNPLVGPNILGVTSGAGFGAVVFILFFNEPFLVQIGAFVFGFIAVLMAYFIGNISNKNSKLMLVLAGIIVGALFGALIAIVKYLADPNDKLPNIIYWLMGSLNFTSWSDLLFLLPISLVGLFLLCSFSYKVNILSLSSDHARFLGESRMLSLSIIILSTLVVSSSVAVSGIIGWVGLLVPHIVRMIFGANNLVVLPMSALIGGGYLILVDTVARSATQSEIPLSILTALIGAPLVGFIIIKKVNQWF